MLSEYEKVMQENDILKDLNKELEAKLADLKDAHCELNEWYEEEHDKRKELEAKLADMTFQRDLFQKAADAWMSDYDKLKARYEPDILRHE